MCQTKLSCSVIWHWRIRNTIRLHTLAQWLSEHVGATLGFLGQGANGTGAYLAGAVPQKMVPMPKTCC